MGRLYKLFLAPRPVLLSCGGKSMDIQDTLFALLRFKLCGSDWNGQTLSNEEMLSLFKLAQAHDMAHLAAASLSDLGLLGEDAVSHGFRKALFTSALRCERLKLEADKIHSVLEGAGIDHMLLKGPVIRPYYPEEWMRLSCDIDFLVHEEDLEQAQSLLEAKLGYTTDDGKGVHHTSMHAPNGIHIEPHFCLREHSDPMDAVLDEVWQNCRLADGSAHRYEMQNEFLLFHLVAHMAYHFQQGGCGIKPFVDLFLLKDRLAYDQAVFDDFLKRAGLDVFYSRMLDMIGIWFGSSPHNEMSRRIEDYVLRGGVYGTKTNQLAVQQEQAGSKLRQILKRIFMPYRTLKIKYPILERYPILTPFFEVVRWINMVRKKRLKGYAKELDVIVAMDKEKLAEINRLLKDVGL